MSDRDVRETGTTSERRPISTAPPLISIQPPPFPVEEGVSDNSNTLPIPEPFVICPAIQLTPPRRARKYPIFVNAEDVIIECVACVIHAPGTHLAFGSHAQNVWIKGLTFTGATTSSVALPHHGAEVNFMDCSWFNNVGEANNGSAIDMSSIRYVGSGFAGSTV